MKILPYLFILLLASAFVVPRDGLCLLVEEVAVKDCCAVEHKTTDEDLHCGKEKSPSPEEKRSCASSCLCLCCSVAFIPLAGLPQIIAEIPGNHSPFFLISGHLFDFPARVWQPPRRS